MQPSRGKMKVLDGFVSCYLNWVKRQEVLRLSDAIFAAFVCCYPETSRNIFWVLLTLELFRLCSAKNVPSPAWLSSKQDRTCCRKPTGISSIARKPSQLILAQRIWEQLSRLCLLDHPTPGLVEMLPQWHCCQRRAMEHGVISVRRLAMLEPEKEWCARERER